MQCIRRFYMYYLLYGLLRPTFSGYTGHSFHPPTSTILDTRFSDRIRSNPENMNEVQKAWMYNEYGSTEVLQFGDFPVPKPGPGQLLVQVRAAALNPADFKRREGLLRNADSDFPAVPGCDMSGVVVEVGDGVSKFKNGDEIYSNIQNFTAGRPKQCGTLAQYTVVEEYLVAPKPINLSFEEAASLPLALQTAQQGFDIAIFEKGQSVFIVGGAGGVGSLDLSLRQ